MRISSLPRLAACPGWWLLEQREPARPSGAAADTGSAVGRAIALYHEGHPRREALELALSDSAVDDRYPRADVKRARRLGDAYMQDSRNPPNVATDCECEVSADIEDAAGAPFRIVGHVDQVRDGAVWDVKAGIALSGEEMVGAHAMQLAGYAVAGAWHPGGIIRLASYESDNGPVFRPVEWGIHEARTLLETIRRDTADLREGTVHVRPGAHCRFCPAGNPMACLARFRMEPPRREEVE